MTTTKAMILDLCDIMNAEFRELAERLPADPGRGAAAPQPRPAAESTDADLEFRPRPSIASSAT